MLALANRSAGMYGTRSKALVGALLLGAIGVTAIVSPPIGALAFIGIGAVVGAIGLFGLLKGLFGKSD